MSTDLKITIDRIFTHLRELGRSIAQRRGPGVDPAIVTNKLRSLGLQSSADLVRLYSLCDGTETEEGDPLDRIQFFPGFYWMALDEAIETYRSLIRDGRWNATWLPILANGGGDFYAVICDAASPDYGGLVGFMVDENDHLVEFKTIDTTFQTIERSFSEKAFFLADGYLEADYPKMRAIARATQPDFAEHVVVVGP